MHARARSAGGPFSEGRRTLLIAVSSTYQEISLVHTGVLSSWIDQGFRLVVVAPTETVRTRVQRLLDERSPDERAVHSFTLQTRPARPLERGVDALRLRQQLERLPPRHRQAWMARRQAAGLGKRSLDRALRMAASLVGESGLHRMESALLRERELDALFARFRPELALVAWGGAYAPCPAVVRAAARHGCPSMSLDASWDVMDERLLIPRLDRLLVWGRRMKDEAVRWRGYRPGEVAVVGPMRCQYYYDEHLLAGRAEALAWLGLEPDCRLVTLAVNRGDPAWYRNTVQALLASDATNGGRGAESKLRVLVRLAPWSRVADYAEFEHEPRVRIYTAFDLNGATPVSAQDVWRSASLVHHTDVMISVLSSLMIESMIGDTPNITMRYPCFAELNARDFVQPILAHDGVAKASDPQSAAAWAIRYLQAPSRHRAERLAFLDEFAGGREAPRDRVLSQVQQMLTKSGRDAFRPDR